MLCILLIVLILEAKASKLNATNVRSNYGTLTGAFVALKINDYLSINEAVDIAINNKFMKEVHNARIENLFRTMNELLTNHEVDWELHQKLMQIPTFNNIKVNIPLLAVKDNLNKLIKFYDTNKLKFIRGIDASLNLPFLLFIIRIIGGRQRLVIAIFDSNDIHSIYDLKITDNDLTRTFTVSNSSNITITMHQIVDLIQNDKCYDAFNVANSIWRHRSDTKYREMFCECCQQHAGTCSCLLVFVIKLLMFVCLLLLGLSLHRLCPVLFP